MLFIIELPEVVKPEKNSETAMIIYESLKDYNGAVSAVFSYAGLNVPISWIKWVYNDAKRLEAELIQIVRDNPAISASAANALLASDYLDTTIVGIDILHYNPTFDEDRTFLQFKTLMNS